MITQKNKGENTMKKLFTQLSNENPETKLLINKKYLEKLLEFHDKKDIEIIWDRGTETELLVNILKNKDFSYIPKKLIQREEVLKYHNSKIKLKPGQSITGKKKQYLIFKNSNDEMFYFDAVLFKSISYKGWLKIKFKERDYHATSIISIEQNAKTK